MFSGNSIQESLSRWPYDSQSQIQKRKEISSASQGFSLITKIENFFSILTEVNENYKLFGKFISCDLSLKLPYNWAYVSIFEPKEFELNDYVIKMVGTKILFI